MHERQWSWISHPLNGLPIRHDPYVVHRDYRIEERNETLLMVRLGEPGGVIE